MSEPERCFLTIASLPLASLPPTSKWPPVVIDQRWFSNHNRLLRFTLFKRPLSLALTSFFCARLSCILVSSNASTAPLVLAFCLFAVVKKYWAFW